MLKRLVFIFASLFCTFVSAQTREPMLTMFKENYFVTGVPLNGTPDYDTNDAAFQVSMKFNAFQNVGGGDLDIFAGFTEMSVWDVYGPSNPFRANTYMAGLYGWYPFYFDGDSVKSDILFGMEHRSNGLASYQSRDLNYVFATYTYTFWRQLTLQATGRFGFGTIANTVSLEMFDKYQGYCNFGAMYSTRNRALMVSASVTPLFKGDIPCNLSAEVAWRPVKDIDWFYLTARYHYGYDENQLDCAVPDVFLKRMLRFGVSLQPSVLSHKLFF